MSVECKCKTCKGACEFNPGWFLPGEAEKAAELLEFSLQDFFNKFLGVNWWVADEDIFLLAPAVVLMTPGEEYPDDPRGTCVFYQDELCQIHASKPFECSEYSHENSREDVRKRHEWVAQQWVQHQKQIAALLGREPEAQEGDLFSFLGMW